MKKIAVLFLLSLIIFTVSAGHHYYGFNYSCFAVGGLHNDYMDEEIEFSLGMGTETEYQYIFNAGSAGFGVGVNVNVLGFGGYEYMSDGGLVHSSNMILVSISPQVALILNQKEKIRPFVSLGINPFFSSSDATIDLKTISLLGLSFDIGLKNKVSDRMLLQFSLKNEMDIPYDSDAKYSGLAIKSWYLKPKVGLYWEF